VLPYPRPANGFFLTAPLGWILLALQVLFYLMALAGNFIQQKQGKSKLRLLFYLPTFLTNSNLAALQGFFQFLKKQPGHLWTRIERR